MSNNTIQARAIQLALAEKGYKEGKRNWNKFARDSFPSVQNQAWCGSFVGDVYRRAGWDCRGKVWMPYVPYIESWAKKIGAWKTNRAQNGDIVVYGFGRTSGQHTGIAYPDESTGGDSYRAIEGNTSSGNSGSQTNGDGVYIRYRKRRDIRGWVDMAKVFKHYGVNQPKVPSGGTSAPTPSKPKPKPASKPSKKKVDEDGRLGTETVKALQRLLNASKHTKRTLKIDGRLGPDSYRSLQEYLNAIRGSGIKVDGLIENQSYKPTELGNGVGPHGWEYTGRGSKGSKTIRGLQRHVGVRADGILYEGTTLALQKAINSGKF